MTTRRDRHEVPAYAVRARPWECVEAGRDAPRLWRLAAPTGFLPTQE